MSLIEKAQETAAAVFTFGALLGGAMAATPAEVANTTVDNYAHMAQEQASEATSAAISEGTQAAGDTTASQSAK
jgi:hypothetical protein